MSFEPEADGSDGYLKLTPDPDGELLGLLMGNFHTSATLAPTYARTGAINTFSGVIVGSGGFSGTTMGLSGALPGASASFSGAITAKTAKLGVNTVTFVNEGGGVHSATPNWDYATNKIDATADFNLNALSGTPIEGQETWVVVWADGGSWDLTWNSGWGLGDGLNPTETITDNNVTYFQLRYREASVVVLQKLNVSF